MSRIGKNEATFKFFFGLSFQLVTRFVCGTSGWNHFFLIVFVDVGTLISFALDRICGCGCWCAGFSPTKKKKRNGFVMWNRCCYLFFKKKIPQKEKHVNRCVFLFQKVCVSSSIIMIYLPNFDIFARHLESAPKVQIRFVPHSVRPLNDSSTVAAVRSHSALIINCKMLFSRSFGDWMNVFRKWFRGNNQKETNVQLLRVETDKSDTLIQFTHEYS